MKTPLGILVLSILAFMAGIMYSIWGLRMMGVVTFGPVESGNGVWLSGLLTLIVGVIYLAVGGALIALRPWALLFAQIMAIFGLVNAVFVLFGTGNLQTAIGAAFLPLIVLWYTNRDTIQTQFAEAEAAR
jgi:hypothetical protein